MAKMKKIIIVHQWGASPEKNWYPWIKKRLRRQGFEVEIPEMPEPDKPDIKKWIGTIKKLEIDEETFLIGHSIGCQTIIRFLEESGKKVKGCLFVAGWHTLTPEATPSEEEKETARPWLTTEIDVLKVRKLIEKSVALLSKDDPYVPLAENEKFWESIGAKVIVEDRKKHYEEKEEKSVLEWTEKTLRNDLIINLAGTWKNVRGIEKTFNKILKGRRKFGKREV